MTKPKKWYELKRFKSLTPEERDRLYNHLLASGTTWNAIKRFDAAQVGGPFVGES